MARNFICQQSWQIQNPPYEVSVVGKVFYTFPYHKNSDGVKATIAGSAGV